MSEILLDPDCRDGKHNSCMGEPCQCVCHQRDEVVGRLTEKDKRELTKWVEDLERVLVRHLKGAPEKR